MSNYANKFAINASKYARKFAYQGVFLCSLACEPGWVDPDASVLPRIKVTMKACENACMKTQVSLRYSGPALDAGRMDVYEASANMIAFSEFMVAAVKQTYGDEADAKAEVSGFDHGSFVTDLVFSVAANAATIFTALTPEQLWTVVKEAFQLWKHLKGSPPSAVSHDESQRINVTNNNGTVIQVRTDAFNLVMSEKGAEAVGRFVKTALAKEGYESLSIETGDARSIVSVPAYEADSFGRVTRETVVSDGIYRMVVTVVSPMFQDGNKWRVNDGGSSFSASILDENFINQVDGGRRFGKGDILEVDMRILQSRSGRKVSIDREIIKVLNHLSPQEQESLI